MIKFYATIDVDSVRPYMSKVPVMLPASSWARKGMPPPKLPAHITERAADCGGFVATKVWGGTAIHLNNMWIGSRHGSRNGQRQWTSAARMN